MKQILLFAIITSLVFSTTKPCFSQITKPELYSPASGASFTNDAVNFSWSSSGKKMVYELMISTNAEFTDGIRIPVTDTIFKKNFEKNETGIRYWKVRAFKSKKKYSDWSFAAYFYIGIAPVQILTPYCNHNCGSCKNPCGRRMPLNNEPEPISPKNK